MKRQEIILPASLRRKLMKWEKDIDSSIWMADLQCLIRGCVRLMITLHPESTFENEKGIRQRSFVAI